MEIAKTLVLSTSHLPSNEEIEDMENDELMPYRFVMHEYGIILVLQKRNESTEHLFINLEETYPILSVIIQFALERDIRYIDFDKDVEVIDDLPKFEW